jgi:hypothetical protein
MPPTKACNPYFWEDIRFLVPKGEQRCASEIVNKIVFAYLVSVLIGLILSYTFSFQGFLGSAVIWIPILTTAFVWNDFQRLNAIEKFRNEITETDDKETDEKETDEKETFIGNQNEGSFENQTIPGVANPFGNVLISDLPTPTKNGIHPAAADITSTVSKVALDDFFRVQWYSDPTDVFGKTQSQRMFVSQASTTIPNDQGSYQNWLYKIPGKTCKEGNPAACYGGTEGAAITWLNNNY